MADLNARQQALLGYVGTIFFDGPVAQKTLASFLASLETSVADCLRRDLPAVGRALAIQGVPLLKKAMVEFVKRAATQEAGPVVGSAAGPLIEGAVESLFRGLSEALAKKG